MECREQPLKSILYNAVTLNFIGRLSFSDDPAFHPENGSDGSELEDDASGKCQRNEVRLQSIFSKFTSANLGWPTGFCQELAEACQFVEHN